MGQTWGVFGCSSRFRDGAYPPAIWRRIRSRCLSTSTHVFGWPPSTFWLNRLVCSVRSCHAPSSPKGSRSRVRQVRLIGPQGIFKPAILPELPLRISTVPIVEGQERPYEDKIGEDGLIRYRYRGTNPDHHENVGLRNAMARQTPLIHFIGVVPGQYIALWPVFIVGDDPSSLSFTVALEDRDIGVGDVQPGTETELRRPICDQGHPATPPSARLPSACPASLQRALLGVPATACGAAGSGSHPARHPSTRGGEIRCLLGSPSAALCGTMSLRSW